MNIQFVVRDEQVYIIEVNPRASRTVPILSKVTKIPMVKIAMEVILGEKLRDLPYGIDLAGTSSLVAVKAPVFSFIKLNDVDVALTPEMKSTGEVLGIDRDYDKALYKAFVGAGYKFFHGGNVLVSIHDESKDEALPYIQDLIEFGFKIHASEGTHEFLVSKDVASTPIDPDVEHVQDKMKKNEINMIFNIPTKGKDISRHGFRLRTYAQHLGIPCFTCMDTLREYMRVMSFMQKKHSLNYETIDYYRKA